MVILGSSLVISTLTGREVIMYRPRYDPVTGTFLSLYETLGYIMVRADPQEYFLDYGHSKQNSKILHSHYKKRVPSSFSGTFFNRYSIQFKSGALQSIFPYQVQQIGLKT